MDSFWTGLIVFCVLFGCGVIGVGLAVAAIWSLATIPNYITNVYENGWLGVFSAGVILAFWVALILAFIVGIKMSTEK